MDTRGSYYWHRIFIIALFVVGNSIIALPTREGINASVTDLFIAVGIGTLLSLLFSFLINKFCKKTPSIFTAVALLPFLFYIFLDCCRDYVIFTDSTKMPNTSAAVIAVFFTVLSIYCGTKRRDDILRLCVILFIVTAFILFFITLLSLPLVNLRSITWEISAKGILKLLLKAFVPSIAAVYFIKGETKNISASFFGTLLGASLVLICLLLCKLVLSEATSIINYPLATVGGTVSIGKGFTRFEGFIYLLTMITCFLKTSVTVFLIKRLGQRLNKRFCTALLILLPILAALVSVAKI